MAGNWTVRCELVTRGFSDILELAQNILQILWSSLGSSRIGVNQNHSALGAKKKTALYTDNR
ncbi:hypothetical protein ACFLTZ_06275 [Chloroflexota bacterium]